MNPIRCPARRWGAGWTSPFQDYAPVRVFPSYKGQRNFSGLLWCATNSRLVGYESWLERDRLMHLDFEPTVVGIASQPFRLDFDIAGSHRWHVPDYFARLRNGAGMVIDVRPDDRITVRDQEIFTATETACATVGWAYRRLGPLPRTFGANLRWLAGYRHPRCLSPANARAIHDCLRDGPKKLPDLMKSTGNPVIVLPAVFHLLWIGDITTDLHSRPLGMGSDLTLKTMP